MFNMVVRQGTRVFPFMFIMSFHPPVSRHVIQSPALVANPKSTLTILYNTTHHTVRQVVILSVFPIMSEFCQIPIENANSAVICSHPDRPSSILKDRTDGIIG